LTPLGRVVAGFTMIVGVGLFALPVGIIATGFVETIHRRDFVITFGTLARVPVFRAFDAATLGEIMTVLRAQSIAAGGIVSAEGERAAAMYFIVSGEVEAAVSGKAMRFATGDFFGEMALLTETMKAATITAVRQTRLLVLASNDFDSLMHKHPELKERMAKLVAERADGIAKDSEISHDEIEAAHKARESARRAD
jgi:voltage-gated potassium channel